MDAKQFLSALRLVIREEVTRAVRAEIGKVLTESRETRSSQSQPVMQAHAHTPAQSRPRYAKNNVLNALLESVTPTHTESEVEFEEWPTMQYGGNPQINSFGSRTMHSKQINAAPEGVSIEAIQHKAPEVAKALTRDYRELVKKMIKK